MTNTNDDAPVRSMATTARYEQALELAGDRGEWYHVPHSDVNHVLQRAQVHATLALVSAVEELTAAVRAK